MRRASDKPKRELLGGRVGALSAQRALARQICPDGPRFDGRTAGRRRMASQYNQKIVAAQPWIGYHPTAGVPKKEIPVRYHDSYHAADS